LSLRFSYLFLGCDMKIPPTLVSWGNYDTILAVLLCGDSLTLTVFPVKIKFLAIITGVYLGSVVLFSPLVHKLTVIIALTNFLLFFAEYFFKTAKTRKQVISRRREFQAKSTRKGPMHRCYICGKTEEDDPKLEFRYCSKCDRDYEYCIEHLKNHEHVKKENRQE
ncbi:hypothetical protein CDO51_12600, partial [Natranaerobius trueperi]